ncbi:MAG: glycoside hydrolase family 13 protein [Ruminococcaceae bacterium]|nr:glycoside hydrolase family 13 protein [Oscillospiraceae bacterium]
MRILFDPFLPEYKSPFGTLVPGEACHIRIRIPVSCRTERVRLVLLTEKGEEYAFFAMTLEKRDKDYEQYRTLFALPCEGLWFYRFAVETENERFSLYRQGLRDTNMEAGELWQLSCVPKDFSPPEAFRGKVMYQIFPDRFYKAGDCDLTGKLLPYSVHENLRDVPEFLPDEKGEVRNCDFFGGNLRGIEEKLDYLSELGVGVIYLNPIFKAWSNHRYDTADYKMIDEMLGTQEDFASLCRAVHKRGMKIILDGVFSHTGNNSRYFDAKGVFGGGAVSDPDSPYRSWFEFQSYPDTYTSWWGITTLPCTRELDEGFLNFIIEDEDSVIARWIRAGADGWRLDVADELPDEFIVRLRRRMKELAPDALLIGEVWEDASNKSSYGKRREYFTAGELDSVMNYPFRTAILDFILGRITAKGFQRSVMDLVEHYPEGVLHSLMNMLSTHDTPRLLSLLSPTPAPAEKRDRAGYQMSAEDRRVAMARFRAATLLQFVLPGMPCVFYGDELGTEGFEDPFCRSFFDWQRVEGNPLVDFFRVLMHLKNENIALRSGKVWIEPCGENGILMCREKDGIRIFAFVTISEGSVEKPKSVLLSEGAREEGKKLLLEPYGFVLWEEEK